MAGLFPGICNAQNVDANGQPLANAVLTVFQGGTDALASVFQDIGLIIPAQNPMTADITGRLPLFYVADGTYKVRLVDQYGVQIYFYPQVASIGASTSGGGGTPVDPTTIFQTGDPLWQPVNIPRTGWVRLNGQTLGSATSGASERANADCHNLFLFIWNNFNRAHCPVVGGAGANAAADWAANKQITLFDMRGKTAAGLDGMGNARANFIPDGNVTSGGGDTGDTPAGSGGEANHVLVVAEMAAHIHPIQDEEHSHANQFGISGEASPGVAASGGVQYMNPVGDTPTEPSFTGINTTEANAGGGGAHNNMQPFVLGCWYIKL